MAAHNRPHDCASCGQVVPHGAELCPFCGARAHGAAAAREWLLTDPAEEAPQAVDWDRLLASIPSHDPFAPGNRNDPAESGAGGVIELGRPDENKPNDKEDQAQPKRPLFSRHGPRWSPLTWIAQLQYLTLGWQILMGREYVADSRKGRVVEFDGDGHLVHRRIFYPEMNEYTLAFVALVPGLGHFWLRQWIRGSILTGLGLVMAARIVATWTGAASNFWCLAMLALMVFCFDYASRQYHRLRGEAYELAVRLQRLMLLPLALLALVALVRVLPVFWFLRVESDRLAPVLRQGEIVLYHRWPARRGALERGDVVYYQPLRFGFVDAQGRSGNVAEEVRIGRILAIPGERVEIQDRRVLVNGQAHDEARPLFEAILPVELPAQTVAPDRYWILYGNIQSPSGIVGYAGAARPSAPGALPEGSVLHPETWTAACSPHRQQILGVIRGVVYPPAERRIIR